MSDPVFAPDPSMPTDNDTTENAYASVPTYLVGADNHSIGNDGFSILSPSTWADSAENTAGNIAKFSAAATVSGATSFYNTGVAVANWFGADATNADNAAILSGIDDDLGQYYNQNKESADLVGFIASSFIPGLGGVKVLNAAQKMLGVAREGMVGTNLARATGLLVPNVEKATALAATDIAQAGATYSTINASSIRALAAGFGQATLESAAFETAVAATMFKSPVLENQDFSDIAENAIIGTVTGGLIGGVITGAGILGKIKAAVTSTDEVAAPFTHITELPTAASPADRIIQYTSDLANTPALTTLDDFTTNYLSKIANVDQDAGSAAAMFSKFQSLAETKANKLNNLVRTNIQKLTGGDADLGNFVADNIQGMDATQMAANLTHLTDIGRMSTKLDTETAIEAASAKLAASGAQAAIDETGAATLANRVGYVKLAGENAGDVSFEAPKVLSLADTVTPKFGQSGADAVMDTVRATARNAKWASDKAPLFDVAKATSQDAEARYLWADRLAPDIKPGQVIGSQDIPMLEKAYAQKMGNISLETPDGVRYSLSNTDDLLNEIKQAKLDVATQMLAGKRAGTGVSTDEIAKVANVRRSFLEGDVQDDFQKDYFARQSFKQEYADSLSAKGLDPKLANDMDLKPTYMKGGYNYAPITGMDGTVLEGMAHVTAQSKIYQAAVDNVVAKSAGDLNERFWHPDPSLLLKANRYGAGPKFVSFANGIYHSLASWSENIGNATAALQASFKAATRDNLESLAYKLTQNRDAAIEFSTINNKIAATSEKYVLNDAGDTLVARSVQRYRDAVAQGIKVDAPKLQLGADAEIPITSQEARDAISAHIRVNGNRVSNVKEIRAAQGLEDAKDASTFYPVRPDPQDYKFFAFVRDPSVTEVGHVSMIHAMNANDLDQLIRKVPDNYQTITKAQSEEWHKATADFKLDRTLHENYIDSDLASQGVNSQFFPATDPQKIANDWMQHHFKADDTYARTVVSSKFDKEFAELRRMGETTESISTSKYANRFSDLDTINKSPMLSYVKTALNINQSGDVPLMRGLNNILDGAFSRAVSEVGSIFSKVVNPADLDAVNTALNKNGIKSAYQDAATQALVNKGPNSGYLRGFIAKSNALISALTVRINPINAINNAVGSTVLLGPETSAVLRGIREGNPQFAGKLSELMQTALPGTTDSITSAPKLIFNAMKNYFGEGSAERIAQYKSQGWITSISDEYKSMLDDLTINGAEKPADLNSRLQSALEKGKRLGEAGTRLSGNKLSEEFNRFVAADVMRQITDVGIEAGTISAQEAKGYISTFINRVHGNLLASQRPLLFQGPVGQAISLFQSYQFNMIQQMLRYVGEGNGKTAAMALGLQGTIYGMSGLPAFNFINQHIIGTLSGNPNHRDAYDALYGTVGKPTADWLMYGLPSNLLHTNIYSHGDMNPRQFTVIPTSPSDIPIVSAYSKFFGSLKDTAQKIGQGGNVWESTLQGIEHAGIIKPLAGLAQTLQATTNDQHLAYSTTAAGNILGTNDLFSLATAARLAGGTPFDEAITKDALFRYSSYNAYDTSKKDELAQSIKSTIIGGQNPSQDQVEQFSGEYAALGGKQSQFNKYVMGLYGKTNTSQANQIAGHLKSPYSQSMQGIMGGTSQMDGRNISSASPIQSNYTASSDTQ